MFDGGIKTEVKQVKLATNIISDYLCEMQVFNKLDMQNQIKKW